MRRNTKRNESILLAVKMGYTVDKNGLLFLNGIKKSTHKINGYPTFIWRDGGRNGINRSVPVHRLQAYQKYGEQIFDSDIVCRHLNGIRSDNFYDNIAIGTYSMNTLDIPKELRVQRAIAATRNHRALNEEQIKQIFIDRNSGMPYHEIATKNGTNYSTAHYAINRSLYGQKIQSCDSK